MEHLIKAYPKIHLSFGTAKLRCSAANSFSRKANSLFGKDFSIMYRDKLEEFRKERNISNKKWAEESGVSVDTINRIIFIKFFD